MAILVTEIIKKKRLGQPNTADEIKFLVSSFTRGTIPDYQMAAWLMAVALKGMTDEETSQLTNIMLHSGLVMDFSDITRRKVDKHSTGGVGDKTTLILGPIVASCGIVMPTIAGRGLAHTGGTLDKLESIPGFVTRLETMKFKKILKDEGLCFMGQTDEICPADKKIYALRDVTSTVDSFPLICASIMSKKLAEGIDGLVLDVKVGTGAFMKTEAEALHLARGLKSIGEKAGKKVIALLTNMDEPLGSFVGNALEVQECLKILRNEGLNSREKKTRELSVLLATHMLLAGQAALDFAHAREMAENALTTGKALSKFEKVCRAHGGDLSAIPSSRFRKDVSAAGAGYLNSINSEVVGNAAILLRAGRRTMSDSLDPAAGIQIHKSVGEKVEKGETLFTLFAQSQKLFTEAEPLLTNAVHISDQQIPAKPLILQTLS